jgi:hypothetical protein
MIPVPMECLYCTIHAVGWGVACREQRDSEQESTCRTNQRNTVVRTYHKSQLHWTPKCCISVNKTKLPDHQAYTKSPSNSSWILSRRSSSHQLVGFVFTLPMDRQVGSSNPLGHKSSMASWSRMVSFSQSTTITCLHAIIAFVPQRPK